VPLVGFNSCREETDVITLQPVKLVSWDVDGTLYSIRRMKLNLLGRFLGEAASGRGLIARSELVALRRCRDAIDRARLTGGALDGRAQNQSDRDLLLALERRWYAPAIQKTGTRAGLTEVLSFLTVRNIPQVVISDYRADYKLESLGLDGRFASIYVGERLGFVKPSPRLFQQVTSDFKVPPAGLLHIGDRADRDEAGALAAGCQCLILGRDFRTFGSLLKRLRSVF
jgi:FMN phosphatase YigB (HAD superfamily)